MADTQFQTPTFQTLVGRISNDLNTRLPGEDSRIRRSFLYVLARVLAGASYSLYGYGRYIARQVVWSTAESTALRRWTDLFGVTPLPPAKASGNVTFSGTATTVIPAGTELTRDDGVLYTTTAEGTIGGGGTADVAVEASESGDDGNADEATALTLTATISGVESAAEVASGGLTGGRDAEDDDDLRDRFLAFVRDPLQGGAGADYDAWTREAPGVSATVDRVFVSRFDDAGTVLVQFTLEGTGAVIPPSGDVDAVQAYIDEENASGHTVRRPVGATAIVAAPTAQEIDFEITISPSNATTKAAVDLELETMFGRESKPGVTIKNSSSQSACGRVQDRGVIDWFTVDAVDGGAGTDDIVADSDVHLPILGTITWGTP